MDRRIDITRTIPPAVRAALRMRYGDGDGADEIMMAMYGWRWSDQRPLLDPWLDLAEIMMRLQDGQSLDEIVRHLIWSAATVRGATMDILEVEHE